MCSRSSRSITQPSTRHQTRLSIRISCLTSSSWQQPTNASLVTKLTTAEAVGHWLETRVAGARHSCHRASGGSTPGQVFCTATALTAAPPHRPQSGNQFQVFQPLHWPSVRSRTLKTRNPNITNWDQDETKYVEYQRLLGQNGQYHTDVRV